MLSLCLATTSVLASPPKWTDAPEVGDKDSTQAEISFVSEVPVILAGHWITFTGASGGTLESGKFDIEADGQFATSKPVVLELHWFDEETSTTGDLVDVVGDKFSNDGVSSAKVQSLTYKVNEVDLAAADPATDVSAAKARIRLDGDAVPTDIAIDSSTLANPAITSWTIENESAASVFGHVAAGDTVTAKTTVLAQMDFVSIGKSM